jgi:hypothetical protein
MSGRSIKVPSLGDIPPDTPPALRDLLEAIIQTLDIREGRVANESNARFVTKKELIDALVVTPAQLGKLP